jgi:hypothetical protein
VNFDGLSEHEYNEDNFFTLGLVDLCKDEHTPGCIVETKFFQAETMKEVRRKIKEKAAGSKTVIGEGEVDGLAAGVGKSSKRKAESAAPEKVAKRTKKEKTVKDTHATEPLPADGSIPSGKDDVTGEPAEPTEFWEKVEYMRRKLGL